MAYYAGLAAEDRIANDYARRGCPLVQKRWRGTVGEIDIILRDGEGFVFVEVKKSHSFDRAALRLSRIQMHRILTTAEEFIGGQPKGLLTEIRFDVALVDAQGCFRIIENAFEGF